MHQINCCHFQSIFSLVLVVFLRIFHNAVEILNYLRAMMPTNIQTYVHLQTDTNKTIPPSPSDHCMCSGKQGNQKLMSYSTGQITVKK